MTLVGIAAQVGALVLFGLAGNGAGFWLGVPLICLGNIAGPAWQALLSNRVGPSEQGRLSGALNGMFAIAGVLSPIAFTSLFALAAGARGAQVWLGAPFFVAGATAALSLALAAWTTRRGALR